jgi:hypothetical protein
MSTEPGLVRLRTGKEVPGPVVITVSIALNRLMDTHPMAVVEAAEIARDPAHVPFGKTGPALEEMHLTVRGVMHDVTRDVILACFEDGGFEFVSPYASNSATEATA